MNTQKNEVYTKHLTKSKKNFSFLWFLLPPVIILGIASLPAFVYAIVISFQGGVSNYASLLNLNSSFVHSLYITVELMVLTVPISIGLGIIISSVLRRKQFLHLNLFVKTILILPFALTPAVTGLIFRMMLTSQIGVLSYIANLVGIKVALGIPSQAFLWTFLVELWMITPLVSLILLAGFNNIPDDIIEASTLETNSWIQRFWYIELPYLRPYLALGSMLIIVNVFDIFDMPWSLTNGGPIDATSFISIEIDERAFRAFDIQGAMSATVISLVIVLIISMLIYQFVYKQVETLD